LDKSHQPLAPAGGAIDMTKDPLLRDKTHGAHLLKIRKEYISFPVKTLHLRADEDL